MKDSKTPLRLRPGGICLQNQTFKLLDSGDVDEAFGKVKLFLSRRDRRSIAWIKGMAKSHLERDYSESRLLAALGVVPVNRYVLLTVCRDLTLLIEYSVIGSDGNAYERNECRESTLISLPLPSDIEQRCSEIRSRREKSDYADIWLGFDGAKIREIPIKEIDWC